MEWWKEDQLEAWLEENHPEILREYASYTPESLADSYLLDLPCWVERHHPEVLPETRAEALGDFHVNTVELDNEGHYVVGSVVRGKGRCAS